MDKPYHVAAAENARGRWGRVHGNLRSVPDRYSPLQQVLRQKAQQGLRSRLEREERWPCRRHPPSNSGAIAASRGGVLTALEIVGGPGPLHHIASGRRRHRGGRRWKAPPEMRGGGRRAKGSSADGAAVKRERGRISNGIANLETECPNAQETPDERGETRRRIVVVEHFEGTKRLCDRPVRSPTKPFR